MRRSLQQRKAVCEGGTELVVTLDDLLAFSRVYSIIAVRALQIVAGESRGIALEEVLFSTNHELFQVSTGIVICFASNLRPASDYCLL